MRTLPAGSHCAGLSSNDRITIDGSCNIDGTVRSRLDVVASGTIYKKCENQPKLSFPSQSDVEKCRSSEYVKACSGGTRYGDVTSSTTITGPKRITGNIKCGSSEKIVLKGPGTIYVDGNVELDDSATLENGTCLVVNGTYTQNSRSCYRNVRRCHHYFIVRARRCRHSNDQRCYTIVRYTRRWSVPGAHGRSNDFRWFVGHDIPNVAELYDSYFFWTH